MEPQIGSPHSAAGLDGQPPAGLGNDLELLRAIVASAQEGIIVLDRDMRYRLWNPFMEQLTGLESSEVIGRRATRLFPHLKRYGVDRLWTRAMAGETVTSPDVPYEVPSNGRRGWVAGCYSPLRSASGEISGAVGLIRDTTKRKEAEAALQDSEQKYRTLVDGLNVGVFQSTLGGTFIHVNRAVAAMAGYDSATEAMGVDARILYADPSDRERLIGMLRRDGKVQDVELQSVKKDGTRYWIALSAVCLYDAEGQPDSLLGIVIDVTERRQVEQALRESEERLAVKQQQLVELNQLLEQRVEERTRALQMSYDQLTNLSRQVPGLLYQFQMFPDGRMCLPYTSEAGRDLLEVNPDDASFDRVHPLDREGLIASVRRSASTLQPWHYEFRLFRPVQGMCWCAGHASPQLQEDGSILWHGFISDVSERKKAEEALRVAKDDAEAATRAKSEFLANMSHEIRTPMNAIMGFIELVLDSPLSEEQREYLTIAHARTKDLLVLINDILDLSRIEAERLSLVREPFSPAGAVAEVLEMFALAAHKKGVRLITEPSEGVPTTVSGDLRRLRQVLVNLVGNAVKFTHNGEVAVGVDWAPDEAPEGTLGFRVRDTGIGIPHDEHEKVFHAFAQANDMLNRQYGGAGLGLTIARRLVTMMGGRIWLESKPGKGSTFHFTVRLSSSPEAPEEPAHNDDTTGTRSRRILLVEDERICRLLAGDLLKRQGHCVMAVESGGEALDVLAQTDFDLVVMDLQMPGIDGLETTRIIRDPSSAVRDHHIPIVALTAFAMTGDERRCREAGMNGYVSKPVSGSALASAIASVVADRPVGAPAARRGEVK